MGDFNNLFIFHNVGGQLPFINMALQIPKGGNGRGMFDFEGNSEIVE